MHLTITRYLDISPQTANERLPRAALAMSSPADTRIEISGIDELATIQVSVPWVPERREEIALAADRFTTALTHELITA